MRVMVSAALMCCATVGLASAQNAHAMMRKPTNISAQPLRPALQLLSKERDIQVVYRTDVVADLRTGGAVGDLTSEEALHQLLKGTGLTWRYLDDKTVTIVPIASASQLRISARLDSDETSLAQNRAQAGVASQSDEAAGLEEIVVTATRRTTTLQDTPINIAAVTGAQIEREGLRTLSEATRAIPGINVIDQGGRGGSQIVVRGLNAEPLANNDNSNDGGGTVATYLGETPVFMELKLNDMERVEVLLGPQGTLYGAGTLGGAIRYIPRRPSFTEASVEVRGATYRYSAASTQSFDGGATVNLPLSEKFAFRASVDRLDDSGFIDQRYVLREPGTSLSSAFGSPEAIAENFRRKRDVNYEKTWSGRVAARWAPADAVDLNLTYYFQNQDIGGRQSSSHRLDSLPVSFGKYESALRVLEPAERDNQLLTLEGTFDLGFAELTSATSYSEYSSRSQRDQTDLAIELGFGYELFPGLVNFTDEQIEEKRTNQELRLVSKGEGPFSWTVGGFYNRFKRVIDYVELTPGLHEFFDFAVGDDRDYLSIDRSEREEYALYGELSYQLTDAWSVTVGGRYYNYDLRLASAATFPPFPATGPQFNFSRAGQKDDGVLGKLNASYRVSADTLAYGTISQGYRGGSSNALTLCPVPLPPDTFVCGQPNELLYTPDKTTNYELGFKSQWLDRRITLNSAVFYIDWKDVQLGSSTQVGAVGITVNGEGASSRGAEFNLGAKVTSKLRIEGNYAYTDAQLDERSPRLIRTVVPPGFAAVYIDGEAGDRLPGSARHRGSIAASYVEPISARFDLDFGWRTVFSGNVLSMAGARGDSVTLPSYSISYARIGLTDTQNEFSVTLYADNVFNKFVEVSERGTPLFNQVVSDVFGDPVYDRRFSTGVLPPRLVGLRFTKAF
ncbi:TonB-dependent receptor domain-containing protein [Peristeroidobacter soli]|uniref:TonB-dependent receptor domain-containing protein n=1 Tax=Peristeroidobacter soli TaxID=2497877 RepID=UPI0015892BDC|nr:TonB-dependent receptor [Peristeroidobacter soli]